MVSQDIYRPWSRDNTFGSVCPSVCRFPTKLAMVDLGGYGNRVNEIFRRCQTYLKFLKCPAKWSNIAGHFVCWHYQSVNVWWISPANNWILGRHINLKFDLSNQNDWHRTVISMHFVSLKEKIRNDIRNLELSYVSLGSSNWQQF